MVQSYLRHGQTHAFGVVCSGGSNSVWDGKLAYVPALEDVIVWDVKRGQMVAMWHETGHQSEVTCLERSPKGDVFAVGYANGSIKLWNAASSTVISTFNGHRKSITALAFDETGSRLASGSQDTDLILWDIEASVGLYRLRGHRDQINVIKFLSLPRDITTSYRARDLSEYILTASKDTFVKVWQIGTQHCVETVVAHSSEVWSLDISPGRDIVLTGSAEGEIKVWRIRSLSETVTSGENEEAVKLISFLGTLPLSSVHRISHLLFHATRPFLAVQTHERSLDIFRIRPEDEIKKRRAKRKRQGKQALQKPEEAMKNSIVEELADDNGDFKVAEIFTPFLTIRASGKIRSFDYPRIPAESNNSANILLSLTTNALEVYSFPLVHKAQGKTIEASRLFTLETPGHRTPIRCLCVSSDDSLLVSVSNDSLKLWNLKTMVCLRTVDCDHATSSIFLPGDRQVVVGTRNGEIILFDIASSSLIEQTNAHTGTIWSMHMSSDGQEIATGSADKEVKFWKINEEKSEQRGPAALKLVHVRTLKMSEDILCVRYSPDGRLLVVSLIDSTVKVFYRDTLKFFLSLYGHKLPVLSMDVSDDSKLLATCSADKNIKLWGLDFGDCHKSIFGHDESIVQVMFEKDSHHFWTAGKDRLLKYWDGDKFKLIQKLEGHLSEIRALALSKHGHFAVTASNDKSIRIWEKLDDEPLFLDEEHENELEQLYENQLIDAFDAQKPAIGSLAQNGEAQETLEVETTGISRQTKGTLMSGERIMEALDIADADKMAHAEFDDAEQRLMKNEAERRLHAPTRHPVLATQDLTPEAYVFQVIEKIPNADLSDALLVLPFDKVLSLIRYLDEWAHQGWNVILVSRIIALLIKTHHHQIVAQRTMRRTLVSLRQNIRTQLQRQRDIVSYNLSALRHLQKLDHVNSTVSFTSELSELEESNNIKSSKRKRTMI